MTLNYVKRKTLDHQALRHNFFFLQKKLSVLIHTHLVTAEAKPTLPYYIYNSMDRRQSA